MNQVSSKGIGHKLAGIFLSAFWALVLVLLIVGALYSCIYNNTRWLKPDYSQPHEFLNVTGYGSNWKSMEGNDYWYLGVGITEYKDNFFPIGNGECTSYLNKLSEEKVRLSMRGFNGFLSDKGDFNDVRVGHVKLQCVEYLGRDKSCEHRLMELAKESNDPKVSMLISLELRTRCDRKQDIGKDRVISLDSFGL